MSLLVVKCNIVAALPMKGWYVCTVQLFCSGFLCVGYIYIRIYVVVFQYLCVCARACVYVRMCSCMYVCILYLAHVQFIKCIIPKILESVPTRPEVCSLHSVTI